ncbi:MAG: glycosyltransferase [Candidatus Nanoarchaeia archaeon]|nr:glycosyltransferase [Candidatus Nanoarchaeia archaeon]MDD5740539.1 glycosyltransferase [Candidatus Nanoarchaeia archaeon]
MISVIIIVKNDRGIENTLNSLKKVKKPEKTEIIVVDASEGALDDIKKKFPKVRWIYFHNKTDKEITIPEQRNLGIKKSKRDIIVFIDAGCTADKRWLKELIRPIREENETFVTGMVKSINEEKTHDVTWKKLKNCKYRNDAGSANTAFMKKIIGKIGHYDENFYYGSDIEFSYRAKKGGYKLRYNPKAIIFHDWGSLKQELKRGFRYGEASIIIYKKHRDKLYNLFKLKENLFTFYALGFFIYVIFIPIISFFWIGYPIFLLIPFFKNIKNNPLRKLLFDFFWGFGVLKELIFPSNYKIKNNNDPQK